MESSSFNKNIAKTRIEEINNFFGDMDLFLMDLLLKGHIDPGNLLDIGFGTGRNLIHFLQRPDFVVHGIESDASSLRLVQLMASSFENQQPENFLLSSAHERIFPEMYFQTVICARVFHFLNDQEKWLTWEEIIRLLKPGGVLYLTANSSVNFENQTEAALDGKQAFPDETSGYFLTRTQVDRMILDTRVEKFEPVRNVQYDDQHAETILVLRKK